MFHEVNVVHEVLYKKCTRTTDVPKQVFLGVISRWKTR